MESRQRPKNLSEFKENENLSDQQTVNSECNVEETSDEEIWIVNVPRTINPEELKGQYISFKGKTNIEVDNKQYTAINKMTNNSITCVCNNDKENLRTVNIKPKGVINIRRKL